MLLQAQEPYTAPRPPASLRHRPELHPGSGDSAKGGRAPRSTIPETSAVLIFIIYVTSRTLYSYDTIFINTYYIINEFINPSWKHAYFSTRMTDKRGEKSLRIKTTNILLGQVFPCLEILQPTPSEGQGGQGQCPLRSSSPPGPSPHPSPALSIYSICCTASRHQLMAYGESISITFNLSIFDFARFSLWMDSNVETELHFIVHPLIFRFQLPFKTWAGFPSENVQKKLANCCIFIFI